MTSTIPELIIGGSNKGELELRRAMRDTRVKRLTLADPKQNDDRLERSADAWRRSGTRVEAVAAPVEEVIPDRDGPVALQVDQVGVMKQVIERHGPERDVTLSGVGRGTALQGSLPSLGLSAFATPGRNEARRDVVEVLDVLSGLEDPSASSREQARTGLDAMRLNRLRSAAAGRSARRLKELDRRRDDPFMAEVLTDLETYPLAVYREAPDRPHQAALDHLGSADSPMAAAFVDLTERRVVVVLISMSAWSRKPMVQGVIRFDPPPPKPVAKPQGQARPQRTRRVRRHVPFRFTD